MNPKAAGLQSDGPEITTNLLQSRLDATHANTGPEFAFLSLPRSSSVIAYDHVQSIVDQPKLNAGMRRPRMPVDVGQGFLDDTKDRPPYREW